MKFVQVNMTVKIRIIVIILSVILVGALDTVGTNALAEDITIGVLVDLSGPNGAIGRMQRDSYLLAQEEINARGGIGGDLIQLDFRDTGGRPSTARSITRHFIDNKQYPLIVGGTGSRVTEEVARVCQSRGVPYLAVSGAEDRITRKGYGYVFRMGPTLSMYQAGAVQYLSEVIKPRKVSVVYERSQFALSTMVALKEAGERFGWNVSQFPYDFGTDDFGQLLARVRDSDPDALFITVFGSDAAEIVAGIRDLEITVKTVIGGSSTFSDQRFLRTAGGAGEGVFFVSIWSPRLPYNGAEAYSSRYRELYGGLPDYHGAEAYSAIYVVRSVLRRVSSRDPGNIRDALASSVIQTAFGPISFASEKGFTNQNFPPTYLQQWIAGEAEIVWPPEFRTAEPLFHKLVDSAGDRPQDSSP